ncbi:hypothetical protein [Flavobacterium sp. UMI-01]|uniref:hypothetical protein n=1 Tax=Flavobacterium sp. UMI-01 TaxID=1441053 RepID=UPI001C7D951F|nr:hypothetical protein [Flavobacterium sp. UMI-01]GIZ09406.1 hypothetical protein FUMI01_21330 [Flavobacterium sp. UMI-01]
MKKLNVLFLLCLLLTLFISCSSDDNKDPDVIFNSITANKSDVYLEESIIITLDGTGFTESNLTSSNTKMKITKISNTTYEVSSIDATSGRVYAELRNNTYSKTKNIPINFYKHGVIDFKMVEGIAINVDSSDKLLKLLGEAEVKTDITGATTPTELWEYPSKGVNFVVIKSSKIITSAKVNSSNFYINMPNNSRVFYTKYPYEIGNGWKIDDANSTMTQVVNKLGNSNSKNTYTTTTLKSYFYLLNNFGLYFYFYADTEDDYNNKTIRSLVVN